MLVLHCLLYIYCFFPLFSLVDFETEAAAVIGYVVDEPSLSAKQPGKQTPLTHAFVPNSFSLLLALEMLLHCFILLLLHSLSL